MGALAKLPIFLDLQGKRAVLAGGTAPACWKAELLEAAGAIVHVYAETLEPELAALIVPDGRIIHHARPWAMDIFDGAAIALADIETDEGAHAFYCAARSCGVPVNVIDKPKFCQFQFGSIVNRSPVIIGISTDGAAPILGQAIRRRIETLMPPALAQWGQLARDVRDGVMTRLAKGAPRRAFWEAFAERSFGAAPTDVARSDVEALIADIGGGQIQAKGRVTLVGAGPGDAELLTLKAVRALQSADVILFDDLVSDEILELARREAKRMLVGKRGQRESCSQSDINALMLKLAGQGYHVVRLKSGDPMIFGRAGEEIDALMAAGVPVTVVPGVTSALAMASQLGVSLTHRDHAQGVRFVTGHARNGELPDDLDWQGLADPKTTLIVYMGGRTAPKLARALGLHGLDRSTPVVAVSGVSRVDEARWVGTLSELEGGALADERTSGPVLIGIGQAFSSLITTPATVIDAPPKAGARDRLKATSVSG
jgi:uroporphyrin-III C-methyltransferase / precorrin-2 dehydrogenase / sirohydrochlorin ferrochelatase